MDRAGSGSVKGLSSSDECSDECVSAYIGARSGWTESKLRRTKVLTNWFDLEERSWSRRYISVMMHRRFGFQGAAHRSQNMSKIQDLLEAHSNKAFCTGSTLLMLRKPLILLTILQRILRFTSFGCPMTDPYGPSTLISNQHRPPSKLEACETPTCHPFLPKVLAHLHTLHVGTSYFPNLTVRVLLQSRFNLTTSMSTFQLKTPITRQSWL